MQTRVTRRRSPTEEKNVSKNISKPETRRRSLSSQPSKKREEFLPKNPTVVSDSERRRKSLNSDNSEGCEETPDKNSVLSKEDEIANLKSQVEALSKLLLEKTKSFSLDSVILNTIQKSSVKQIEALLKQNVDLDIQNEEGLTPLHISVLREDIEILDLVLNQAPSQLLNKPDKKGQTPLHHAAKNGLSQMVNALLNFSLREKMSLDVLLEDTAKETAYSVAKKKEIQQAIANYLLLKACKVGNIDQVAEALALEADVNARDRAGLLNETPLHKALHGKHFDIAKLLLEHGADSELKDKNLQTPFDLLPTSEDRKKIQEILFFIRVEEGETEEVASLLQKGIDPDAKNEFGLTALHIAVENEDSKMITVLADGGANINELSSDGETPLHEAVEKNSEEICGILLKYNADITIKNNKNTIAPDLAEQLGNQALALYIYKEKARLDSEKKKKLEEVNGKEKLSPVALAKSITYTEEKVVINGERISTKPLGRTIYYGENGVASRNGVFALSNKQTSPQEEKAKHDVVEEKQTAEDNTF